jgi:transmembrane sensor
MNQGDQMREAVAWHASLSRDANEDGSADGADWDGFTAWLEADPGHRQAYDAVALGDALVDEHRDAVNRLLAAPATAPWWRKRGIVSGALGGAIAASLTALLVVPAWRGPETQRWQTRAGESRTIAFADGAQATLAPGTKLAATGGKLTLDGTAFFAIRHDPSRPVTIAAAGVTVSDVGTRFDMAADKDGVRVAVAEGQVAVAPAGQAAIPLAAGHRLLIVGGKVEIGVAPAGDVAAWRGGRLVYDRAPLSLVAADIARYAGGRVTVDPSDAGRRFSGAMAIGDRVTMARSLAVLMGLDARIDGETVTLGDRSGR